MDDSQNLTKWEFKDELILMAESCIDNKRETARKKAKAIFEKYNSIIAYSTADNEYLRNKINRIEEALGCIRSGMIEYAGGALRVSDVESYQKTDTAINIKMKSGNEIRLSKDFDYITEIFK